MAEVITGVLPSPRMMVFDWHGTLVDTIDAMYGAIDDLFPRLAECGLLDRLLDPQRSRSLDDAKLVNYVREHYELHPKIKAARKLSRTDIFEVLFGSDAEAKEAAHALYDECYRAHYGEVQPFEPGVGALLMALKERGIALAIVTNRNREFLMHELALVEGGAWQALFGVIVCGDDVVQRKPAPEGILKALRSLNCENEPERCWCIGDSTTDIIAGHRAGTTTLFYNGAQWNTDWLQRIFPRTPVFPEAPDAIFQNFAALERLIPR